jgi:hypothetical protein
LLLLLCLETAVGATASCLQVCQHRVQPSSM